MREIRIYLKQRVCHAENPPLGNFSLFSSQRIGLGPRYYTIRGSIPLVDGSAIFVVLEWL